MSKRIDIYGGHDPLTVPAYTIPMAAAYLWMSSATLRTWVNGYAYQTHAGRTRKDRVIVPASHAAPWSEMYRGRTFLSFENLIEAHILLAIRKTHELSLPRVRKALKQIEKKFPTPHPLARRKFATDGTDLFVETVGKWLNVSDVDQPQLRLRLTTRLKRIEYEGDVAKRLFPLRSEEAADTRLIVINPRISFGRPVIAGTGVPVAEIKSRFDAGDSIDTLVKEFDIDKAKVEEALRAAA